LDQHDRIAGSTNLVFQSHFIKDGSLHALVYSSSVHGPGAGTVRPAAMTGRLCGQGYARAGPDGSADAATGLDTSTRARRPAPPLRPGRHPGHRTAAPGPDGQTPEAQIRRRL